MRGPLAGKQSYWAGGHAGSGNSGRESTPHATGYGDVLRPETMGSGGGFRDFPSLPGGSGGGVVRITFEKYSLAPPTIFSAFGQGEYYDYYSSSINGISAGASGSVSLYFY